MIAWIVLAVIAGLSSVANAGCTGASPTWSCTADRTSLDLLINSNNPGTLQDGDTINITQAGSFVWTVRLTITNKSFSLIGPGRDLLTITCTGSDGCLNWQTKSTGGTPAGFTRLSGITWRQSGNGCFNVRNGVSASINIFGSSGKTRIDNNRFYGDTCNTLHVFGNVRGVIDHNIFVATSTCHLCHSINLEHDGWLDVGGFGDSSWASLSTWGSENQLVVEDNQFTNSIPWPNTLGAGGAPLFGGYASNDSVGARATYRFNTWDGTIFSSHGTESNGRWRGQRHNEIYRNQFVWERNDLWPSVIGYRGGTNRTFDNAASSSAGKLINMVDFSTARRNSIGAEISAWSMCGEFTITSITTGGTATATATWTGGHALQVSNGVSYVYIFGANESKFNGAFAAHRTGTNTFVFDVPASGATVATGTIKARSPFDGNTNATGYPCMDQFGRGKGILLDGEGPYWNGTAITYYPSTLGPIVPVNNELEPAYIFSNKLNGTVKAGVENPTTSDVMTEGIDYYNQSAGITVGPRSARPAAPCTPGTAHWATDGGGDWNKSTTEGYSTLVGYSAGADGGLDRCNDSGGWDDNWYVPFVYPHPLVSGVVAPSASATIAFPFPGSTQPAGDVFVVSGTALAVTGSLTQVGVYIDGVLACTDTVVPFASWNCSVTAPSSGGTYTLTARATDGDGLGPPSSGVSFTVPSSGGSSARLRIRGTVKVR